MSIDWNWGIFLQQAPFGNTTYLGWISYDLLHEPHPDRVFINRNCCIRRLL